MALYLAVWPVYVVRDDPGALAFTVAVDSHEALSSRLSDGAALALDARRQYITQVTRAAASSGGFPVAGLARLPGVLRGVPAAARRVAGRGAHPPGWASEGGAEVRQDILGEADGPMLRFGLQGFHLQALQAPRARELRPSAEFLAERFELFRKAG